MAYAESRIRTQCTTGGRRRSHQDRVTPINCDHFRFTVTVPTAGMFRINSLVVSNIPEIHRILRRIV
jgi:hypothetical protein